MTYTCNLYFRYFSNESSNTVLISIVECMEHGYIYHKGLCLRKSTTDMSWFDALNDCASSGGHLIVLDSLTKHTTVVDILNTYCEYICIMLNIYTLMYTKVWAYIFKRKTKHIFCSAITNTMKSQRIVYNICMDRKSTFL